jgi:hypothetical protein
MTGATREGTMPRFAPERFVALVERFLAELGTPWPSPAPPEEVTEREVAYGDDAQARRTTRRASHGGLTMNVEQTVWRELDSNGTSTEVHTIGTLSGLAGGAILTVEGERSFERWRVSGGGSADVQAIAASFIRLCDAVFREGHEWYEHPAIPPEWMRLAKGIDVLGETQPSYVPALERGYLLFHPTRMLIRDGASWLFYGTLTLDVKRVPIRLLGPFPAKCPISCMLTGKAADGVPVMWMDAQRVARAMLGGATWKLEHDTTRPISKGGTYHFIDVQRAGQLDGPREVASERCRIWRSGDWIMRMSEVRSEELAHAFELTIQNERGGHAALVADGREKGKPHGCWQPTSEPMLRVRVLGDDDAALRSIVAALATYSREEGWTSSEHWEREGHAGSAVDVAVHAPSKPWPIEPTAAEAGEIAALGARFTRALRGGAKFHDHYREEWDACELKDGKLVWTSGWIDDPPWRYELQTDEDVLYKLLFSAYSARPVENATEAIARLREAVQRVEAK